MFNPLYMLHTDLKKLRVFRFRFWEIGVRVEGRGFGVWDLEFGVKDLGFRGWGLGIRVT
jgi:hypothetical protein